MEDALKLKLLEHLTQFLTDRRRDRMLEVLPLRTRYISVALENIYQAHNASAVLRSCDCFGVQDVHIIENSNPYTISKDVDMGSSKWLSLFKYRNTDQNTANCIETLKADGYRIVATTPHGNASDLGKLDLHAGKVALLFGTELKGLSQEAIDLSDECVRIPMYGFTESYNISVSAALCLYDLRERLNASDIPWELSPSERLDTHLTWIRRSLRNSKVLEDQFMEKEGINS